jgi:hypothetical protein
VAEWELLLCSRTTYSLGVVRNSRKNRNNMKKPSLILTIFILIISFLGCKEDKKEAKTENPVKAELTIETADFEIAKTEDQSRKALGKKPLSQYTTSELERLPTNKKILYRVILSKDIKENQVKPTVEKIVNELTSDDSDIDEIILWFYSSKEVLDKPYDIGTAIWAPNGKLGNIDANIAKNNNRENYKIEYRIKENLEQYLEQNSKSEVKFGITENERKQIFKDIVNAEDTANEYERIEQDKVLDGILEKYGKLDDNSREKLKKEYDKISEKAEKIITEGKAKVFKKYKITEEQAKKISTEALTENWPFE